MGIVLIDTRVVSALVENPFLFAWRQFSLELPVVSANHTLQWIIVAIPKIISSFRNSLRSLNIIGNESQTIWAETFENLSIETSIFVR